MPAKLGAEYWRERAEEARAQAERLRIATFPNLSRTRLRPWRRGWLARQTAKDIHELAVR